VYRRAVGEIVEALRSDPDTEVHRSDPDTEVLKGLLRAPARRSGDGATARGPGN